MPKGLQSKVKRANERLRKLETVNKLSGSSSAYQSIAKMALDKNSIDNTAYELLLSECELEECIIPLEFGELSLIPSNVNLAGAEKLTGYICEYLIDNGYSHTDRRGQDGYELWDEGLKNYREYYKNGWSGKGVDVYD
jgi:hypothetical protein